jgi:hypothetical protein
VTVGAIHTRSLQIMLSPREMQYIDRLRQREGLTRSSFGRRIVREYLVRKIQEEGDKKDAANSGTRADSNTGH